MSKTEKTLKTKGVLFGVAAFCCSCANRITASTSIPTCAVCKRPLCDEHRGICHACTRRGQVAVNVTATTEDRQQPYDRLQAWFARQD